MSKLKCPFCNLSSDEKVLFQTKHFCLLTNKYPILPHHYLLIVNKHILTEDEFTGDVWSDYQDACSKSSEYIEKITGNKPLVFINPPQMQSVPHFHRNYASGIYGVHGVVKALQGVLNRPCTSEPGAGLEPATYGLRHHCSTS